MNNKKQIFNKLKNCVKEIVTTLLFIGIPMIAIALIIKTYIASGVVVIGDSMNPTLHDKQLLIGASTYISDIERNDVVSFKRYDDNLLIKRVIALPGDTLEIKDNQLIVNGKVVKEDYIKETMFTPDIPEFTLPMGQYFVMGDNRNNSGDSRQLGLINEKCIKYVVVSSDSRQAILFFAANIIIILVIGFIYSAVFNKLTCQQ